jgi:alpha-mannosidase
VATYRIRSSDATVTYEMRQGDPALYVHVAVTWFERGGKTVGTPVLRLSLPLALAEPATTYEIPFGAIERDMEHGEEVPALRWAAVQGRAGSRSAGLVVANDCKHGHSFLDGRLGITLIRSSYDPDPLPEIGAHEAHFALEPFAGRLSVAAATARARRLDHEIRVISTKTHAGTLGPEGAAAVYRGTGVVLSAIKRCEDGQGLLLRFYNTLPKTEEVSVQINTELLGRVREAVEVDLMERPVERGTARSSGNKVSVKVAARGIATLRVRVEVEPAKAAATAAATQVDR